ncbi:MAG: caspase family protein, partial [Spirochaetota bacterium]
MIYRTGIFLFILFFLPVSAVSQEAVRRYAMIVGANDGGSGRVTLKYAVSDAASFRDVMIKLGGVSERDSFAVYNPDKRNFFSAMRSLRARIDQDRNSFRKSELFFYYSGHSDETGILIGNEKITYSEL